ncbi:epsin-1-like [Lampris incognitus]|uniref:epsin-1-like n=1 Tax=Lampris incognitus TaxID=2546036 RepID=UPI0024B62D34|nr:epsin-1-like [Lampris incognitus]
MTSSMLRRQLKNLVQNYSEAEVKVREATSNDPWGPSSSQMADISDLTYNVVACNEIMTMLWKRLKDDKNWRHIHKSLTLLEYLLKTGDDRVLLKMKDNIYIVKALTEFRFVEKDGKDQGANVREKAKVVLVLMEDDEKLKEERDFAVKTREKTSKSAAASSSDTPKDSSYKPCYVPGAMGLPSLDNIPSVAEITASFAARKEERLKQEADKKETERRAKMSQDELKWEDAGKAEKAKPDVWGGMSVETEKEEEKKTDLWGAPEEPKEATDPWGIPTKPTTTTTAASNDPWGAPTKAEEEDPFGAPKTDKDPFSALKNGEDPFAAPKEDSDPFSARKEGEDPFALKNGSDPFNAPKDDPFAAPKDKEDPFTAPVEKPDHVITPSNDPFNTPKDDPFNAAKDDPFHASNDDLFSAPKDDPFNSPKEDPFNTAKDDPFTAPKDGSDPFTGSASTPPKEDPFTAPMPLKEDPFAAPNTPPKEDPFFVPSDPSSDDPFGVSAAPPNEDPFAAPTSPPRDDSSDPFSAPAASPPTVNTDTWGIKSSSPPATGLDPWGAPSAPQTAAKADNPWDDGKTTVTSPTNSINPFGDASTIDSDPWGAPAAPPASADDAWGSPAPPTDSASSDDPFGDGKSKTNTASNDPWGAPGNPPSNGTGEPTAWEREASRKTAAFLGSAGALLVDVDSLLSSDPKPQKNPFINTPASQTQATGALKGTVMACRPAGRTMPIMGMSLPTTSPLPSTHFGSILVSSSDVRRPSFTAPASAEGGHIFQPPSHSLGICRSMPAADSPATRLCLGTGILQPASVSGIPPVGVDINLNHVGAAMLPSASVGGNPLMAPWGAPPYFGAGMVQPTSIGGSPWAGVAGLGVSTPQTGGEVPQHTQLLLGRELDNATHKNNNPFLF